MASINQRWAEQQFRRWMQPNAHMYLRPDAYRYMAPGAPRLLGKDVVGYFRLQAKSERPELEKTNAINTDRDELLRMRSELAAIKAELKFQNFRRALKANFNPNQPRDDHGKWTDAGNDTASVLTDGSDPRILSDAEPEGVRPGSQYAQGRGRGPISVRIGNQVFQVEGGQAARLIEAQARAESSTARARNRSRLAAEAKRVRNRRGPHSFVQCTSQGSTGSCRRSRARRYWAWILRTGID